MSRPRKFEHILWVVVLAAFPLFSLAQSDIRNDVILAVSTREALFGSNEIDTEQSPSIPVWKKWITGWQGFSQLEVAYAYNDPAHFSKARLRNELSRSGQLNEYIKWKISGRFDYDAIYDLSNFYPGSVRRDQRQEFFIRENYVDISAGSFDFRLGRQHVVWGEMVGLFFADVASAKDMREFVLPDFDILRIPQWAVRAEYTHAESDFHAELLWIPIASFDKTGKPDGEFFPFSFPVAATFLNEDKSGRNIAHSNYGLRLSQLIDGWDISAFYYHSLDAAPTFFRVSGPTEPLVFQARHEPIDQAGLTFTKDLGTAVLKGELIYTDGRRLNVTRPAQMNGLVRQDTLDYVLGLDFNLPVETRMNLQFFQRIHLAHDPDVIPDEQESGASILLNSQLRQNLETQVLLIHSLNRSDWMLRPRLSWNFVKNWRMVLGADIFGGRSTGFFGRFDDSDRVYTEVRYTF
ncbi:hypothetical protein SAMN05216419_105112 [Nitrosomonas cryotolerans]|uniref:Alginate export domain-containing protein n=1 Tax=Nitrosomonas cryotolerans ATCC 49181 TaxID=1131553 RepID=A0A1N6HQ88_9PROT|nr:DUF1302 family protein [Nitrosomonas cryotolerans]SFQ05080.1 hypothetical protein SAMN05216419_105112 [Nitrosomonas cryotolerans]SIO21984.1 hypothetical protein SAMN02743940_1301 [Nitrosomonas cryotolerans ATCC 49181]